MGQSLSKVYIHITFSTKKRTPLITDEIEDELYSYLGGICKALECHPIQIGGHQNHVHILCQLSKKITQVKLIEELKKHSSKWIKTKGDKYHQFYWQNGYGVFSVNPIDFENLKNYILNQKVYHSKNSFQDEYLALLKKYKINFDERFIWD